jgi:hypothetical protein
MALTPEKLADIDAVLDKICSELVQLARSPETGNGYKVLMNAAYQIEQIRKLLLAELSASDDRAPFASKIRHRV